MRIYAPPGELHPEPPLVIVIQHLVVTLLLSNVLALDAWDATVVLFDIFYQLLLQDFPRDRIVDVEGTFSVLYLLHQIFVVSIDVDVATQPV